MPIRKINLLRIMIHLVCAPRLNYELYVYLIIACITYVRMNSATITNNKYREVTKTIEQNHAGSVLSTSSWKSKLGCASSCDTSQCISFSYNSVTKECKTYGEEICYRDDGVTSSSLRFYTKVVQFDWVNNVIGTAKVKTALKNCGDIPTVYCSRAYTLTISPGLRPDVLCDMDTGGGPWTVILSRYDGSVDFYKPWSEYKNGFGSLSGEFWLGFEKLRLLLAQDMKLRIELQGWTGSVKHVEYDTFYVSEEASEYRLTIGGFSTPDDLFNALASHNDWRFSTVDNDNDDLDGKCTSDAHGAWWYGSCYDSNLFGPYSPINGYASMIWKYLYGSGDEYTAVKTVRMMLKKA